MLIFGLGSSGRRVLHLLLAVAGSIIGNRNHIGGIKVDTKLTTLPTSLAWHKLLSSAYRTRGHPPTATLGCVVLQALMHAREYPLGSIDVDEPRDLTSSPPLLPPRHRLAGPPSTWLTGDWQGVRSGLRFHPGTQRFLGNQINFRMHHKQLLQAHRNCIQQMVLS